MLDIKRRVYTSGKEKSFLDSFMPEQTKDVTRLKKLQAAIHDDFKDWVKARRGDRLNGTYNALMEGAFWAGDEAFEKGLIDGMGVMASVMKEEFGEDVKFIDFAPEKKWLPSFLPFGDGEARSFLPSQEGDIVLEALDAIETRGYWSRYGL